MPHFPWWAESWRTAERVVIGSSRGVLGQKLPLAILEVRPRPWGQWVRKMSKIMGFRRISQKKGQDWKTLVFTVFRNPQKTIWNRKSHEILPDSAFSVFFCSAPTSHRMLDSAETGMWFTDNYGYWHLRKWLWFSEQKRYIPHRMSWVTLWSLVCISWEKIVGG